ncbi:WhiB family transcriptional regulator [Streptomyces sp. NPDC058084]|uniref:WhiB family transcriptional regulator n=1 Tax=Streptomyces sp. NPDC058084 TaxID=3346333 RepID=UPI0036E46D1C
MTTAVLTRPTTASADAHWARRSACTADTAADFFGTSAAAEARAREVCLSCPVRVQCLTARSAIDQDAESWGVVGGLDATQRRVLEVAELLGERPDLDRAVELLSPQWRYRLHNLRSAGYAPRRIAEVLTTEGIAVDTVTVRVALWWTGGQGKMLSRRASRDRRPLWRRVRDEHAEVILRLHELGARLADGADYLGVGIGTYQRVVKDLREAV